MVLLTAAVSFTICLLLIPVVKRLSVRWGVVANPRADRWHKQPTPLLGGVAMFLAYAAALLIGGYQSEIRWELLIGPALVFGLGLWDDFRPLAPPTKLIGQILAATLVVSIGYIIDFFDWTIPNIILTFIWIIGITNAINLLDNMDGLAAGVSLIAVGFLSFFFWQTGTSALLVASLALLGAILGFLIFNFPPASIFMGDSGSLFLGYTLAAIAIARTKLASNVFAVIGVPILLLLLPILDTVLVTFTRIIRGQSPVEGGSDHTSHRLVAFGLTERQAVLVLYGIAIISGIVGTTLESLDYALSLVLIPLLLVSLALLAAYLGRLKVVPAGESPPKGAITRLVVELTFKRRLLEVMLDFILIGIAYYLAYWTHFGFSLDQESLELIFRTLPIALAGVYLAYFLLGVYRGLWRYAGVDELFRYARASIGGAFLVGVVLYVFFPSERYAVAIFFLFAVFLLLSLVASRFSFRVLDRVYSRQAMKEGESNVLIYGAGDAGEMALRWILMNPGMGFRPVGILDDDPFKQGRQIHGVDVLGGLDQLERILMELEVDGIILTPAEIGLSESFGTAVGLSRERGIWVRRFQFEFELVE